MSIIFFLKLVCDEGHKLKNKSIKVYQALNQMVKFFIYLEMQKKSNIKWYPFTKVLFFFKLVI
jgi:hypothetical protein